jgi:hypothetical protein
VVSATYVHRPVRKPGGTGRHVAAIRTPLIWICEAVVFAVLVAILVTACASDGVNRFGDWSDE